MKPYSQFKIYGPYLRKDGRQHIIARAPNGIQYTISYPKYLMECHLERLLDENEEVHHKDEDYTNNNLDNLIVVTGRIHRKLNRQEEEVWICGYCGNSFIATISKIRNRKANLKRNRANSGPFCSSSCRAKVNN